MASTVSHAAMYAFGIWVARAEDVFIIQANWTQVYLGEGHSSLLLVRVGRFSGAGAVGVRTP